MSELHPLPIGSERVTTGDEIVIRSPFDDRELGRVPKAGPDEVDAAVHAARAALTGDPLLAWQRAEILDAAARFQGGDEHDFQALLYAPEMHDPDLIIRTSGEQRLSNYLMWQSAYSELVFRDELWPDFDRAAFEACLAEFSARRRRFGGR